MEIETDTDMQQKLIFFSQKILAKILESLNINTY